jgi:two-component system, OmpR family, sensor histidine kinase BaeS
MKWFQHSLTVKWLFTLLFTGLCGIGLVGVFANRTTSIGFDQLKLDQAQEQFANTARAYYEQRGSWAGVSDELEPKKGNYGGYSGNYSGNYAGGMEQGEPQPRFMLADESNRMLICTPPYQVGDVLSSDQLSRGEPLIVDDQRVGTVLFGEGAPTLDPFERRFLERTNRSLLFAAVGAIGIALLAGTLLVRHFMRPLQDLTQAIQKMQQGQFGQEVPVRGQDELGKLTQAFNQMSSEVAQANFLRRQMTADVAHDLRTPLTIISGHLEGLQDGTLKPNPQRFEAMGREVIRLRRLVDELRTLSLADAGELKLTCEQIEVGTLLQHVAAAFQPLLDKRQLRLQMTVEPTLPPLWADRERIGQVLGNLMSNAIRHTAAGGMIALSACKGADGFEIAVRDTGEGIPSDKLPYIFERLYRVNDARSQRDGESGLGLAIVKSIVEAHGGRIVVQSEIGRGTTLTVRLPASRMQ